MHCGGLLGLQLLNILITWYFRFQLYDRWLKLKYFVKNKTVYKNNTRVDYCPERELTGCAVCTRSAARNSIHPDFDHARASCPHRELSARRL